MKRLSFSSFLSLSVLAGCLHGVALASSSTPQIAVAVTGVSQVIVGGPATSFSATLTNTANTAVTWSIQGYSSSEKYGTITSSGVYTPPNAVPVHAQIQIVATSQADATRNSASAVTIANPVPVITSAKLTVAGRTVSGDVYGTGFTASSQVLSGWGMPTTYVSSTHLQFTLLNAPAAGGSVTVSVVTPAPGRTQSGNYSMAVPASVGVSVAGSGSVAIGTPTQYTATVTGTTNTAVTWSIAGYAGENDGSISSTGLYTPPASVPVHGQIYIVATSQADSTKSASASAMVANPVPEIKSATLTPGNKGSYLVDVLGSNFMPASAVIVGWGQPTTYISPSHLQFTLTSPPALGSSVAISVVTPAPGRTQSANYNLLISTAVSVTASGAATAYVGSPVQYTAIVGGTANSAVTWSVFGYTGENDGTISASGLYTPPSTVPVHGQITITATSTVDASKSSSVGVTLTNPVPAITGATLTPLTKGGYLVDVTGSNFMAASSVVDVYGQQTTFVSPTHLQFTLTNPPGAGTLVPISVVTPAPGREQSANYSMAIPGAIAVSITGQTLASAAAQNIVTVSVPVQYRATVTGTANTAVTWSLSGYAGENDGTISATGLYTPPATVPTHTVITITATSQALTSKSASVTVTLANPIPMITAATFTPEYHSTFLVDVMGTGFMPNSSVLYLGYGWATTFVSPTHLQFTLTNPPAAGTLEALGVVTPAPGRVQSANYMATIPATVGVTVAGAAQPTVTVPQQYTATVTGTTNLAVTWTLAGYSGENDGTLSASGLYTPPASLPVHNSIKFTATSVQDTSKSASITISLLNLVPVITSGSSTAESNGAIVADLKGQNFITTSGVSFNGIPLTTTYVSAGELTAVVPPNIAVAQTAGLPVPVWVVNPGSGKTQSASYNLTLPGQVGVAVFGAALASVGVPTQYVATVTGTQNTGVSWSIKVPNGVDASAYGSIDATGLYTPPVTMPAGSSVTIVATSTVEPSSNGTTAVTLVTVPVSAAARLLDQSTFGPTDSLIQHVQTVGLSNYIDEQIALPATTMPLVNSSSPAWCTANPQVCIDENWWNDAVTAPDQLRQRVAMALNEMLVVSYEEANGYMVQAYSNMLVNDAFANWSKIMKDTTLSPAMGSYLNMVNSGKPRAGAIANENFARENMQLFNLGLNLLNQDGTLQTDSNGAAIPAYTEANVEAFSRVFTGWTFNTPTGSTPTFPNYTASTSAPMVSSDAFHDTSSKVLLGTTLPAGQTAERDLDAAIQDVFNHQNVGPFVTKQLIEHLVKSNPTPAYVGRIAEVFANDGTGVRGNMAAVVKAILLDPEARAGDTDPTAQDGYLREPILWTTDALRGLGAVPKGGVTDVTAYTSIDNFATSQGQKVFSPATVFNFYPAEWALMNTGLNGPQFALETSATIMQKLTLASNIVDNYLGKLWVDLSATSPLGVLATASDSLMLDKVSNIFLHGQMPAQMRSAIMTANSGVTDPAQRVRTAVYLVLTSPQYRVVQ